MGLACREAGERGEEADLTASLDISCKIVEADGKESGVSGECWRWRGRRGEGEGGRGVPLEDNILYGKGEEREAGLAREWAAAACL